MIPLPVGPNAVVRIGDNDEIINTASNISSDFTVLVVRSEAEFKTEAANKTFDSTRPVQPVQVLSSAASAARHRLEAAALGK